MKRHHYKVSLEYLQDPDGNAVSTEPLEFEIDSPDEIFEAAKKLGRGGEYSADSAAALALGLKLLGVVMLDNTDKPLFADFRQHFATFMKGLKKASSERNS